MVRTALCSVLPSENNLPIRTDGSFSKRYRLSASFSEIDSADLSDSLLLILASGNFSKRLHTTLASIATLKLKANKYWYQWVLYSEAPQIKKLTLKVRKVLI